MHVRVVQGGLGHLSVSQKSRSKRLGMLMCLSQPRGQAPWDYHCTEHSGSVDWNLAEQRLALIDPREYRCDPPGKPSS